MNQKIRNVVKKIQIFDILLIFRYFAHFFQSDTWLGSPSELGFFSGNARLLVRFSIKVVPNGPKTIVNHPENM